MKNSQPIREKLLQHSPWIVAIAFGIIVAAYIWTFRALPYNEKTDSWGQFGDLIGGLLNPLISLFTLLVAVSVWKLQKSELLETRTAIKNQAVDQFFMGMLAAHRSMVEQVTWVDAHGQNLQKGKRAVDSYLQDLKKYDEALTTEKVGLDHVHVRKAPNPGIVDLVKGALGTNYPVFKLPPDSALAFFGAFCVKYYQKELAVPGYQIHHAGIFLSYEQIFGHIFRSTYQILKLIDEEFSDKPALAKRYVNLLRAQMSESEFTFFSLSAITKDGEKSWARSVRLNFFEDRLENINWTKNLVSLFERSEENLKEASKLLEKEK
jgi:hypothetical protein